MLIHTSMDSEREAREKLAMRLYWAESDSSKRDLATFILNAQKTNGGVPIDLARIVDEWATQYLAGKPVPQLYEHNHISATN